MKIPSKSKFTVEGYISEAHKTFYELLKIYDPDSVQHRKAVVEGLENLLKNRTGWSVIAPGHFSYTNGSNIFIDPVTPPNTWELITHTAIQVLRIELEEILKESSKEKTIIIQEAGRRLIEEQDWTIYYRSKKLNS